jgi:hypothetical protein
MKKIILSWIGALLVLTFTYTALGVRASVPTPVQDAKQQKAKTFTGTIIRKGDTFVLSDAASKVSYMLDDAQKASEFEGKKVKVIGTVDVSSNTIHVESIVEVA